MTRSASVASASSVNRYSVPGFKAVPACNVVPTRSEGVPFHPKDIGNGSVVSFGGKKMDVAGDTEIVPEVKGLEGIDAAFLPMNLLDTMAPEMVAAAARRLSPETLYPYRFGEPDAGIVAGLLGATDIEVRIREMK